MLGPIGAVCFARMIGIVVELRVIDAGKMEGFTPPDTVAGAGKRTIPLLERPADSAGVTFDRMIHRAEAPSSAMRFCRRARVVEEPSAPRWLFSIALTAKQAR